LQGAKTFLKALFEDGNGDISILGKLIKIVIIFLLAKLAIKIVSTIIDKSIERRKRFRIGYDEKKANTLATILKNISKYVFYFIAIVIVLDLFGIKTTSILATAGIGGLAIGFGAQNLVKDVITGFFILFEDQFSVGDYVKIGEFEGIVEEMGIRVTKIRDFSGDLHIIPNSSIQVVTNMSNGAMRAKVDISIAYEEDIDKAIKVLENICEEVKIQYESILDGPNVLGVTKFGEYDIVLTIIAKTKPMEQWRIERELRKRIKDAFEKEDIEIPYPRMVVMEKEK
jgi:small-conductance mechanosensitive channel